MKKFKNKISLVINVKNEENNLKDCINSAKEIVDEVLVADMQSTDKTVEIAKKLGAKVISVPDYGYVEPARNLAIGKALFEWVLVLDADERLTLNLRKNIKKTVSSNKYDVVYFPSKDIHFGKWIKHAGWWPDYKPKLFKKDYLFWNPEIHSQPTVKGKILRFPAKEKYAIFHYNTKNVAQLLEKNNRYTNYSKSFKQFKKNKKMSGEHVLNFIENEFWYRYLDQGGYKEGIHGYVLSKFMEYYRFLEFAREWERKGYKGVKNINQIYNILKKRHEGIKPELEEIERLKKQLSEITSAKTFKIWQSFVESRKKIFKFLGLKHD